MTVTHSGSGAADTDALPPDLAAAFAQVYRSGGFTWSYPQRERESADYGAYTFALNDRQVCFRMAKTTPTKVGQFVTLWKRQGKGPIQPFDQSDAVDYFVVSTRTAEHFGQFVFPKSVLCDRDIVSNNGIGGKRAMRVYPPWDTTISRQASASQRWQCEHFLDMKPGHVVDANRVHQLYFQPRESVCSLEASWLQGVFPHD